MWHRSAENAALLKYTASHSPSLTEDVNWHFSLAFPQQAFTTSASCCDRALASVDAGILGAVAVGLDMMVNGAVVAIGVEDTGGFAVGGADPIGTILHNSYPAPVGATKLTCVCAK